MRSPGVCALNDPTATQLFADEQDTDSRELLRPGLGVAVMVHTLPSHRSTRACPVESPLAAMLLVEPTAMHESCPVQTTDRSTLWRPSSAMPLGTTVHRVPSHTSVRGFTSGSYGLLTGLKEPTAMQKVFDVQATDCRSLWSPFPGVGLGTTDHRDPARTSTRVWSSGLSLSPVGLSPPTATHQSVVGQAAPFSQLSTPRLSLCATDHARPSHASTSAVGNPADADDPTATHAVGAVHTTDLSSLRPFSFGVGTTAHRGAAGCSVCGDPGVATARTTSSAATVAPPPTTIAAATSAANWLRRLVRGAFMCNYHNHCMDVTMASAKVTQPAAIPHTLSPFSCIDFVNSRFTDHTGTGEVFDRLQSAEWREWFAQRCGVIPHRPASVATIRALAQLRDVVRNLLESGRPPDNATLAQLNEVLGAADQVWELSRARRNTRLSLTWRNADWAAVMSAAVASYGELLASGRIRRVKVCANPGCTFIFFDESRNRSRRWCESAACGNLVKVRAHRARQRRALAVRTRKSIASRRPA